MTSAHARGDYAKYSHSSSPYKDPEFPADESSLYWRNHLRDSEQPNAYNDPKWGVTGWARPSELVKTGSPSLFGSHGVLPLGTNQGGLGDCWFLASCSALAEYAPRIEKIFTNKDYNKAGIFEVTFFHMTEPVKVVVDDQLPIREGKDPRYTSFGVKTPVNSRMSDNGAWW